MDAVIAILESTLRLATPLVLGAMGAFLSERSGIINICIEGMMLVGAFLGAVVALAFHSEWLGFFMAGVAGSGLAALYAFFVINWQANQIVAGTAINMLAAGIGPFFSKIYYGSTMGTPNLPYHERFIVFPTIVSWAAVALLWGWLRKTPSGLWVAFAGENPKALDAAGRNVRAVRWLAVVSGGFLAGLGGGSLSLQLSSSFVRDMTAGRGFMALAALILGKWNPLATAAACLLFGFADALQIRLQDDALIPVQFIQILPYVLTLVVLAGFLGRSRAPKAIGQHY